MPQKEPLSIGEKISVINGASSSSVSTAPGASSSSYLSSVTPAPLSTSTAVTGQAEDQVLDFGDSKPGKRMLRIMTAILIIILLLAALLAFLNYTGRVPFNPPLKKTVTDLNNKVATVNNKLQGLSQQVNNVSIANPVAGPPGATGSAGTNGINGTNGRSIVATGATGANGAAGTPGLAGATGPAGTNGTNGNNGTNGTNGTSGVGVPTGGSTNQTLVKASNTNYDTIWQTLTPVDLQGAYNNSTAPASITTTSAAKTVSIAAGSGNDSASLFKVQDAASNPILNVDSTTDQVSVQGEFTFPTIGSDLVTNGSFTGNAAGWTLGGGWTYGANKVTHTPGSTAYLEQAVSGVTLNQAYVVTYTVSNRTAGSIAAKFGCDPSFCYNPNPAANNHYSFGTSVELEYPSDDNVLHLIPSSDFDGTIDDVSIQPITASLPSLTVDNAGGGGIEVRTGGGDNVFIGNDAGTYNNGFGNVVLGISAFDDNVYSSGNVILGTSAAQGATGDDNIVLGTSAFQGATGNQNIAIGVSAGQFVAGIDNIAIGVSAGQSDTGSYNASFGLSAGGGSGSDNLALGEGAGADVSGNQNTSVGYSAGTVGQNGNNNTFVGSGAGDLDSTMFNLIDYPDFSQLPYDTFYTSTNLQNATGIGNLAIVQASNSLILGGQGTNAVNVGIGTTAPTNTFSVSPDIYDSGKAYQSGTGVVGVGTTWTANMVGMQFIFNTTDGSTVRAETITGFTNATHLTASVSQTVGNVTTPHMYRIHNPAFYVSGTGSASFRSSTNSTTAFQIQNAVGSSIFTVDTTNTTITLGSASSTPVILVLGNKNTSGDPTCTSGGIYYNSNSNAFRGCKNGVWRNLIETPNNASTADQNLSAGATTYLTGSSIAVPTEGLQVGTQFIWRVSLNKTDSAATAANTFLVKYGINGTTADTTELSFGGPTQTAVTDNGVITIMVTVRSVNSSTGTWYGSVQLVHNGSNVGLANTPSFTANGVTGSFNDTTSSAIVGLAITTGASCTLTIHQVQVQSVNL